MCGAPPHWLGPGLSKGEQEDGSCVQNWLSLLPDRGYEVTSCFIHLSQAMSLNASFLFKAVFVRNFGTTMRKITNMLG